jgi:hypothetical protein
MFDVAVVEQALDVARLALAESPRQGDETPAHYAPIRTTLRHLISAEPTLDA